MTVTVPPAWRPAASVQAPTPNDRPDAAAPESAAGQSGPGPGRAVLQSRPGSLSGRGTVMWHLQARRPAAAAAAAVVTTLSLNLSRLRGRSPVASGRPVGPGGPAAGERPPSQSLAPGP